MNYRVTWDIDVEAETPLAAVEEAWRFMHEPDSTANVFTVSGEDGSQETIDLEEVYEK